MFRWIANVAVDVDGERSKLKGGGREMGVITVRVGHKGD